MEVGWHLRFARADALVFLVGPEQAPAVEDAVFIQGDWLLDWTDEGTHLAALARRKRPKGER